MKIEKIFVLLLFASLYCGSLFITASYFVDMYIVPKWIFCLIIVGLITFVFGILIFFKKCLICNLIDIVILITSICILQAGYGIWQYFYNFCVYSTNLKIAGSFDNPAGFASCLCSAAPFFVYLVKITYLRKIQWVAWGGFTFLFIAILLSQSRSGIVSIVIVLIAYSLQQNIFRRRKTILLISICVLVVGIYCFDMNSADGRLFIWKCAWRMVENKPLCGYGLGAFEAHYMDYQAQYFGEYPNSKFIMLADNVKHVFNGFLSIGIQFGILGWLLLGILVAFLVYCYQKAQSLETQIAGLSLLGVGVFACFSYPFMYPFVWIIVIGDIAILIYNAYSPNFFYRKTMRILLASILVICSSFLLYKLYFRIRVEIEWREVVNKSLKGQTIEMLPRYQQLMTQLGDVPYFLYNYAVELYIAGYYNSSLEVAKQCRKYWADYDLELLQGEILSKLGNVKESEYHYRLASQMCPVRFIPLFRLYVIYKEQGYVNKARKMALQILGKPIKVDSPIIQKIKQQVKNEFMYW